MYNAPTKAFHPIPERKPTFRLISLTSHALQQQKKPLDVPLLKEQNFLFSLSLFPFTETNQIMITGSLEKVKNPLHELNPLSFIQQGLKLSSA